ncbi:MAG: tetratricopeptide repeat protein [Wenzhouxiangellaceae bacterium]|nr:tetratricopeptide repeat protein [Wenzhouxiangellaceae bacterium]
MSLIARFSIVLLLAVGLPPPGASSAGGATRDADGAPIERVVERAFATRDLSALGEILDVLDRDDRVGALRLRARLADRMGAPGQALDLTGRAIELAPVDRRPGLLVEQAGYRARMVDGAGMLASLGIARALHDDLEQAIALEPENVDALDALIAFHRRAPGIAGGDRARARELQQRLAGLDRARALYRDARSHARRGDPGAALAALRRAIDAGPDAPREWLLQAARWADRLERPDEAVEWLEQLLDELPDDPAVLYELGRIGARHGTRLARAVEALERYLVLPKWPGDPGPEQAWMQLGLALQRCGRPDAAAEAFSRALALDPGLGQARKALAELEPDGADAAL